MDLFDGRNEKMAACKVKPCELVGRDHEDKGGDKKYQGEKDDEEKVDLEDDKENDQLIGKTKDLV